MYDLPTSIHVNGEVYPIHNKGDFRTILNCFSVLNNVDELEDDTERIYTCLLVFYDNLNTLSTILALTPDVIQQLVTEMFHFFNCGQAESVGANVHYNVIDWDGDSQIIISAINNVAHKEIRAEAYVHWWTFMGYYMSVGESVLSNVTSIRLKLLKGKKLEKYESDFKRDNPQYFVWNSKTNKQKEADELVKQLWNQA